MDQSVSALLIAALTSLFTLLGVYVANRHNSKENTKRLEFDLDIKEKERLHTLKKDILFTANDEFIKINKAIGGLANPLTISIEDNDAYNTFLIAMNRVVLVGNKEITLLVSELIDFYTYLYLEIKEMSDEIVEIDNNIKIKQHFSDKHTAEIDRILSLMQLNYESDEVSVKRYEKHQITLKKQMERRAEIFSDINNLHASKVEKSKEILLKMGEYFPKISRLSKKFSVSARKEMIGGEDYLDSELIDSATIKFVEYYKDLIEKNTA
ncbi:hypothetical protein [Acinetobacter zhairhuonensis]|uniref:hypothetical protein n=1 Tax=Acinetobacter sp. A7.4 TaxID=2919921 RepID=UPI001F4F517C|nr:hypothetical protein [Acinetobacter sp. A7.4]MCJ8161875.1 hypothetical protein [Acinetobacter sp. A7.4]